MGRMGSIKLHGQLSLSGSRLSSSPGTLVQFLIITAYECGGRHPLAAEEEGTNFHFPSLREMKLGAGFARKQKGSQAGRKRKSTSKREEGGRYKRKRKGISGKMHFSRNVPSSAVGSLI